MSATPGTVDVHQHLWPPEMIEALRRRTSPPRLEGWTLHSPDDDPHQVDPSEHDPARRAQAAETELILLSLSAGMSVHDLPPDEAAPLLDAWHEGVAALVGPFRAWAAVTRVEPDLAGLARLFERGFVGLEVSAAWLATPELLRDLAPVLAVCEAAGRPVFVHPGPVPIDRRRGGRDSWWVPVVEYTAQLQAAWWSWIAVGASLLPRLRICFAAGAGLAPAQLERYVVRGGRAVTLDGVFVDTSSYGPIGVQALLAALGPRALAHGSDRPYAAPRGMAELYGGHADQLLIDNPARLLGRS